MENKTIALDQEAYALLKSHKKGAESFSDVVKRHFRPRRKLSEIVGAWIDLSEREKRVLAEDRKSGKEADHRRSERVRRMGS